MTNTSHTHSLRLVSLALALLLSVLLAGCGGAAAPASGTASGTSAAQNGYALQYDLGVKYLNELNYEQAILAFTEAISIDDRQPDAYRGRADAYTWLEEYDSALADLQKAAELDPALEEELWLRMEVLANGGFYEDEYGDRYNAFGQITRNVVHVGGGEASFYYDFTYDEYGRLQYVMACTMDGTVVQVGEYEYDEQGNCIRSYDTNLYELSLSTALLTYDDVGRVIRRECYHLADGTLDYVSEYAYNEADAMIRLTTTYYADGAVTGTYDCVYDDEGRTLESHTASEYGSSDYYYVYDDAGRLTEESFYSDGVLSYRRVYFYDGADTPVRWEDYDASGALISYTIPQFENGEMRSAQTFDPQGKLIAEDVVNEDGSILTYTYND